MKLYNSLWSKWAHRVLIIAFISFPYAHQKEKAFYSLAFGMKLAGNKTALTFVSPPNTANMTLVRLDSCLIKTVLSAEGTPLQSCSLPEWDPYLLEREMPMTDFVSYSLPNSSASRYCIWPIIILRGCSTVSHSKITFPERIFSGCADSLKMSLHILRICTSCTSLFMWHYLHTFYTALANQVTFCRLVSLRLHCILEKVPILCSSISTPKNISQVNNWRYSQTLKYKDIHFRIV